MMVMILCLHLRLGLRIEFSSTKLCEEFLRTLRFYFELLV